ncbi:MAG: hypothetical protein ACJ789_07750 [Thermomicrobiales bacterium]
MKSDTFFGARINRRSFALGGTAAVAARTLGFAGVVAKQATPEAGTGERPRRPDLKAFTYFWSATSPATHKGDTYTLIVKNAGSTAQKLFVRTVIMDHRTMTNTPVVSEAFTLDPGADKTLTATNDYGDANHFATRLLSETNAGLELKVTLTDATGHNTATFTQGAFLVQSRQDLRDQLKSRQGERRKLRRMRRHGRA